MISDSEMDDFQAAILEAGFEVADFNPVQVDDPTPAHGVHAVTGTVTVHRQSTDIAFAYPTGHDSSWLADFEADLQAGQFGEP